MGKICHQSGTCRQTHWEVPNGIREYITALEEHGELRRVNRKVDWNLETGTIIV